MTQHLQHFYSHINDIKPHYAVLIQRCDRDSEFLIASRLLCFRSGCQIVLEYWPGDLESAIDKYFHLISS
jgi:hypothetical protein